MEYIDQLDYVIVRFLNQFAGKAPLFDAFIKELVDYTLLKGALFMACLWGLWLSTTGTNTARRRQTLIVTVFGASVAVVIARILQHVVPSHSRPLHTSDLNFTLLQGVTPDTLNRWYSFPSDHAVLFFALSLGLWFQSRRLGYVAMAWTAIVICLPRIYLGYHWPSDVIGGALIGFALMALMQLIFRDSRPVAWTLRWEAQHRLAFYGLAFLMTYQVATLFADLRHIASESAELVQSMRGTATVEQITAASPHLTGQQSP